MKDEPMPWESTFSTAGMSTPQQPAQQPATMHAPTAPATAVGALVTRFEQAATAKQTATFTLAEIAELRRQAEESGLVRAGVSGNIMDLLKAHKVPAGTHVHFTADANQEVTARRNEQHNHNSARVVGTLRTAAGQEIGKVALNVFSSTAFGEAVKNADGITYKATTLQKASQHANFARCMQSLTTSQPLNAVANVVNEEIAVVTIAINFN